MNTISLSPPRIDTLDVLKGLIMVVMALDHTRDYFHWSAFVYSPSDENLTTLPIFFTRWITHFCAPGFSFLAGVSAFLVGRRKSKLQLSWFLLTRGLWLIFLEATLITFGWFFDLDFHIILLVTIWALGVSMVTLAGLLWLPFNAILIISCLIIAGHNLADGIHFEGNTFWALLHEGGRFKITEDIAVFVGYPAVPWVAVMPLGYCFGRLYIEFDAIRRRKWLNWLGLAAIILFILLRGLGLYGDPEPWHPMDTFQKSIITFLNPEKYPPSLQYLLMTLGPAWLFLANMENIKSAVLRFFITFGRVPFFYYILHLFLIHALSMLAAEFSGFDWRAFIMTGWISNVPALKGYGFPLWGVYIAWLLVIAILYPICLWYDRYKTSHKHQWWLSYI